MKIMIKQDNGELRFIGTFKDGTFRSTRKRSKHLYRNLNAWGLDVEVFNDLYNKGLKEIVIEDVETRKTYRVRADIFKEKSVFKHFRPFRPQLFLTLKYWEEKSCG